MHAPERLARARQIRLGRFARIQPRPLNPGDGAGTGPVPRTGVFPRTGAFPRIGGDGGDQRRKAAHAAFVAMEQRGMEAKRGEAAAVDRPGAEIGLGMGAVDGAAALPQAAGRLGAVVAVGTGRGWHRGQREEGARLGKGGAERARAGGDADEIQQIAVRSFGGIRPLSGHAGRRKADEEGAAPGAADVAGHPVTAAPAALRQVAPAHLLGAGCESCGDLGGRAHDARFRRERGPAEPGQGEGMRRMARPLRMLRGTRPGPGQRPASRRRGAGGRCAKREPSSPAGWGTLVRLQRKSRRARRRLEVKGGC